MLHWLQDFKIQNIVGSCDAKFPIRLEGLAYAHGHFSSVRIGSYYYLFATLERILVLVFDSEVFEVCKGAL
jgi:TATA-box binding protein (TBP) (component of TFIID and TFIIIB)